MTRIRPVAVIALSAALAVSGCTTLVAGTPTAAGRPTTTNSPPPTEPDVDNLPDAADLVLEDCTGDVIDILGPKERQVTWECGTLAVPLDYADPDGERIDLAVVRARLTGQQDRVGALLINPGGPGGSGTDLVLNLAYILPPDIMEGFDLVGFDPRGVNFSDPAIECVSDEYKDELYGAEPYVRNDAEFALQAEISETIADMCHDEYGDELGLFNTLNTARDMDQLRESLGDEQLSYLGYSYGTTLGSTYAELFPDNVRALVLDAATNPTLGERESTEAQARGFESAFDAFAADCVEDGSCAAGDDPKQTVLDVLDAARQAPLPTSGEDGRTVAVGLVLTGVLSSLYDQDAWPMLAEAIGAAAAGDGTELAQLADQITGRREDGSYPNRLEANLSVNCADTDDTFSDEEIRAFIEELRGRYPLFGAPIASSLLNCARWEAPRHPLPERDAEGADPIMVIGTTNDPATPYTGAQAMASELDSGFLLTWDGEGHTAYPKTPCISAAVDAYLIDLVVPADDSCPAG